MLKTSCIQITSSGDINENIEKIKKYTQEAVKCGAQLICTPENSFLMKKNDETTVFFTQDEHPGVKAASEIAQQNKIRLLIGSIAVLGDSQKTGNKTYNRSFLFSPEGKIIAAYDKIHLFDVNVDDGQTYRESDKIIPGDKAVLAHTPWGKIGMTICYDLRFPKLFNALANSGAKIITVPAAFTKVTGEAHWHVLLRARAIEAGCFIIAPGQTGTHEGGRQTFGHSLIVNPWGEIIADAGEKEGIITAEIDLSQVEKTRAKIPNLNHEKKFTVCEL